MNTLADRLKKAFDPSKHSQADLARAAKVKAPSVSDWFSGETKTLRADPLLRAAAYLNVEPLWLASGEGPMRRGEASSLAAADRPPLTAAEYALRPVLQEPPATRYVDNPPWPLPGVTPRDFYELLTPEMRAEVVGYARGLILSINRTSLGNGTAN